MTFKKHYSSEKPKNSNDLIFGIRPMMEAIDAGKEFDQIYLQKNLHGELIQELQTKIREHSLHVSRVPIEKLNRITRKNHQGVVAFLSPISFYSLDNVIESAFRSGKDPCILLLDRITDVRNFGAICRTSECLGVDAVVVPWKGSARISGDALKTSAGALNHLKVCREGNLLKAARFLKESGLRVVACTEKGIETIESVDMNVPLALIMGSEEDGVGSDLLKISDNICQIPMVGRIASLNVSVATGILLYEMTRQRGIKSPGNHS